ncbi:unnamed protein product [Peronospora belbahrii]|uniref:Uncharacterized protein n=1 Tax=Peronospora belbahrii TaxID=622444 RepID=A0ABN8CYB3_9STRA|nr:unnamed protein product [Peronospora belbahrii]
MCKKPGASNTDVTSEQKTVSDTAKGAATGAGAGFGLYSLVTPIINMIGFGAGGIASGSTAASMMSAAAIANGGGVASGSTVAIMQSIGAAGLATPIGLGLVAGGAVVGGIAFFMKSKTSIGNEDNMIDGVHEAETNDESEEKGLWVLVEITPDSEQPLVRTFNDEYKARNAFLNSSAASKALFDFEQKITLEVGWNESMTEMVGL